MRAVFIGGCGRSGTTLLGSLLGSHPSCITTPESQFKLDVLRHDGVLREPAGIVEYIQRHPRYRIWQLRDDLSSLVGADADYTAIVLEVVRAYARAHGRPTAGIWVDHTGANLHHAVELERRFSEARFVHIVRDGRGVAASVLPLDWGPNTVHHAAHWWCRQIAFGLSAESHLRGRIIRVRFEDLVGNSRRELERVCGFLDLPFHEAMLEGGGFSVPRYTINQHRLVGYPPQADRVDDWERRLTRRQLEIFETITADLLPMLGYDRCTRLQSPAVRWSERIGATTVQLARGLGLNRLRRALRLRRAVHPL